MNWPTCLGGIGLVEVVHVDGGPGRDEPGHRRANRAGGAGGNRLRGVHAVRQGHHFRRI